MKIEEAKHLLRNNRITIYIDVDDLSLIKTILKETFPEEEEKDFNILKLGQYVRRSYGSWNAYEKPPFGHDVVKLSEIEMKKYTINQIKEEKIAVYCNSHDKAQKLCEVFGGKQWYPENSTGEYEIIYDDSSSIKLSWVPNMYNKNYFTKESSYKTTKCIDFNEIDFDMKQKQIGWIVKPEYLPTVERILGFKLNENPYGHFGIKSIVEEDLANLKVLDLFSTPKYQEEKSPVILNIGSKQISVSISDKIVVDGHEIDINNIVLCLEKFSDISVINKEWTARIFKNTRCISIGCSSFSIEELLSVVDEFNKWHKK